MEIINNIGSIHCKVSYDEQIRRFALTNTEFTSLRATIQQLFSLKNEFVLKYKDDESDYVTLETQRDFVTALMVSPKILRVLVAPKNIANAPASAPEPVTGCTPSEEPCGKYGRKRFHHQQPHHQYPHHQYPHHQPHHQHHKEKNFEKRRFCVEKKLAYINLALQELADDSQLPPQAQWKKQRLLQKKQRLETFLSGDFHGKHGHCGNQQRKEKRTLSPEEEEFNGAVKMQIGEVKEEIKKIKLRQREIKMLLQSNRQDPELCQQLAAVKEQKHALKAQKRDLCDKMHS